MCLTKRPLWPGVCSQSYCAGRGSPPPGRTWWSHPPLNTLVSPAGSLSGSESFFSAVIKRGEKKPPNYSKTLRQFECPLVEHKREREGERERQRCSSSHLVNITHVYEKIKDKKIQYIDFDFKHFLKLHYSLIKI